MPPNGKAYALNIYKNVIYTSTAQGCGGLINAMYSYNLDTAVTSIFLPQRWRHVGSPWCSGQS